MFEQPVRNLDFSKLVFPCKTQPCCLTCSTLHPLRVWATFCARKVEPEIRKTKPFPSSTRITYSILETRKWSTKKKKILYKKTGSEGNFLNIIWFLFHKGLFCELDIHIVMISIATISGSWKMEGGDERFEDLFPPKIQKCPLTAKGRCVILFTCIRLFLINSLIIFQNFCNEIHNIFKKFK